MKKFDWVTFLCHTAVIDKKIFWEKITGDEDEHKEWKRLSRKIQERIDKIHKVVTERKGEESHYVNSCKRYIEGILEATEAFGQLEELMKDEW